MTRSRTTAVRAAQAQQAIESTPAPLRPLSARTDRVRKPGAIPTCSPRGATTGGQAQPSPPSAFMALPAEIRVKIYKELMVVPELRLDNGKKGKQPKLRARAREMRIRRGHSQKQATLLGQRSLLLASRQVFTEFAPIFYSSTAMKLRWPTSRRPTARFILRDRRLRLPRSGNSFFKTFLRPSPVNGSPTALISHIRINTSEYDRRFKHCNWVTMPLNSVKRWSNSQLASDEVIRKFEEVPTLDTRRILRQLRRYTLNGQLQGLTTIEITETIPVSDDFHHESNHYGPQTLARLVRRWIGAATPNFSGWNPELLLEDVEPIVKKERKFERFKFKKVSLILRKP